MKLCQGNRYVATLHAINNCLVKLSKITPAKKLYRGMTNLRLPEPFYKPDPPFKLAGQAQGGGDGGDEEGGYGSLTMGGVEFGFMSATGDRSVAVRYSSGNNVQGLILEIDQGMLDRGASLQWLSQYPHEAETCFPPCACRVKAASPPVWQLGSGSCLRRTWRPWAARPFRREASH